MLRKKQTKQPVNSGIVFTYDDEGTEMPFKDAEESRIDLTLYSDLELVRIYAEYVA